MMYGTGEENLGLDPKAESKLVQAVAKFNAISDLYPPIVEFVSSNGVRYRASLVFYKEGHYCHMGPQVAVCFVVTG